ncbi:MAG: hypothetical protein JKY60_11965 [Kordiimonadaceae bacterium]|nr:hypothetical protein [Kordiimonadaceae bacterium]
MAPLIKAKDVLEVRPASCVTLIAGDLIIFRTPRSPAPVIKKLVGVIGDQLRISDDGRIYINDVLQLTPNGVVYRIRNQRRLKLLQKYQGAMPGYFVLGNMGTLDSTRILFVAEKDIIGVVVPH